MLAGASGTIGRAVKERLQTLGAKTICVSREDLESAGNLVALMQAHQVKSVISCIASRSGSAKDAMAVDYGANLQLLRAAQQAAVQEFILLSAICVQRPHLAFQRAKLAFEEELANSGLAFVIIRPTAFFKSLSGQVERVANGKSFFLFGDGELTRCKPISDRDLAMYIVECLGNPDRHGSILPIGGPGPALSLREQGEMIFELAGLAPRFRSVPVVMFDAAIALLSLGERWSDWFSEKCEYARIARYYATQSMLVLDPVSGDYSADLTPEYGTDTLRNHYAGMLSKTHTQSAVTSAN